MRWRGTGRRTQNSGRQSGLRGLFFDARGWRQSQWGFERGNDLRFFSLNGATELFESLRARADLAFVAADGLIVGVGGFLESVADPLKVLDKLADPSVELLGGGGDVASVLGLSMMLSAHADGAEDGQERGGSGQQDPTILSPNHQLSIAFQGGTEKRFRR